MNQGMEQLLSDVASEAPTPGGGSVSALAGALGAALTEMVWQLTLQKQGQEQGSAPEGLDGLRSEVASLRRELLEGFDRDAQSYERVLTAFRLPKATEEDKAARREAVEAAMQHATRVPLDNARLCARVMDIAVRASAQGYQPSVTDAGVGMLLGHAGLLGCLYNVELNLQSVRDMSFAAEAREVAAALRAAATSTFASADEAIRARIQAS